MNSTRRRRSEMRNPNYKYYEDPKGGWEILLADGTVVWGRTKAAARSRLLRKLRFNRHLEDVKEALQAEKGGLNDQS
jgi:hypothetical protein